MQLNPHRYLSHCNEILKNKFNFSNFNLSKKKLISFNETNEFENGKEP